MAGCTGIPQSAPPPAPSEPVTDALARRVAELAKASGDQVRQVTRLPGQRFHYLQRKAGQAQFRLVMRVGLQGAERVLVDPQQLAQASGVPHAINCFVPSWDGRSPAYGSSAGGSEDASLHLMDIASGKPLRAPIPRVLFGPPAAPALKLDRIDVGAVFFAPGSRYMLARTTDTTAPGCR